MNACAVIISQPAIIFNLLTPFVLPFWFAPATAQRSALHALSGKVEARAIDREAGQRA